MFRIAHLAWGAVAMGSLGYIWVCALRRRRGRFLAACIGFLSLQGIALVVGRGDCPFGPLQSRLGDPVPMFELLLPPRAAKAAVPVLAAVTVTGIVTVALRARTPARPPGGHRMGRTPHR